MRTTNLKQESFIAELQCDRCGAEARHDAGDGFNNFLLLGFDAS